MRSAWSSGALGVLALSICAACARPAPAIEEAKKKQAQGDLDAALAMLQTVRATSPGSADDVESARLATAWLLAAAAQASGVDDRRRRLGSAVAWSPSSGEAAARLCLAMVDQGQDPEAEKCLAERLAGKTAVPDDVVREARGKLATRKEEAAARERSALLASGRPAQLQALIDRWPGSPEAAQANERMTRAVSVCADVASLHDDLKAQLALVEKLAVEAEVARKADVAPRLDAYERLGKDAAALSSVLKNKGIEAEAHAAKPGEERLRTALHDGFWSLADLAGDLGEGLAKPRIESDESYDERASHTVATWGRSVKLAGEKLRKEVDGAAAECPGH